MFQSVFIGIIQQLEGNMRKMKRSEEQKTATIAAAKHLNENNPDMWWEWNLAGNWKKTQKDAQKKEKFHK